MNYELLTVSDIALAASLVVANGILSIVLKLGLERQLLIASVRMVVQLSLVGFILQTLFALQSPFWTGFVVLVMLLFAGREIAARQDRSFSGLWSYGLGTVTMMVATVIVTLLTLTTQVQPDPWYDARYALPLLGMIMGNTMTGVSLGLDTLTSRAGRERASIEAQLALGQPREVALRSLVRDALRAGFMPMINAMAATGLVSLPGMMTGQILAGVDPVEAVKYQLLIMFLIGGATGFGVLMAVLGGAWRLTDERHRLRLDRLQASRSRNG
ncbi:MAG: iron export ABC transporter permease subunit FetB [Rhodobiaceae bacterium]|nr:MAG: iron export ABC transporter permease subunit FetB [Rhodobiaceae bacterium]